MIALAQRAIEPLRHVAVHVVPFLFVRDLGIHYIHMALQVILVLEEEDG